MRYSSSKVLKKISNYDLNFFKADLSCLDLSGVNLRCANLSGANLSDANLSGANLSDANLWNSNLSGVNLRCANLSGANLIFAKLTSADLRSANLSGADLSGVNLIGANLSGANLSDAYLLEACFSGANLSGTNLSGATNLLSANLRNTDLSKAINLPERFVPQGEIVVYKRLKKSIAKLEIPASAKRSNSFTRKCRAEYAKVVEIVGFDGKHLSSDVSIYDNSFVYNIGEIVRADAWDDRWWIECSSGIHFFLTREEALDYNK